MKNNKLLLLTVFSSMFLYAQPVKKANPFDTLIINPQVKTEENPTAIFQKLESGLQDELTKRGSILKDIGHKKFLKRFYRQNSYTPLWFTEQGLSKKASILFQEIERDITIDSQSKIYRQYQYLDKYIKNSTSYKEKLHIELQLTALYLDFLKHILYGEIHWKSFDQKLYAMRKRGVAARWVRYKAKYSLSELILKQDIAQTIEEITPKRFGYSGLLKALEKLRFIQGKGAWEKLPRFKKLALGDKGDIVLKLRKRLEASGDLTTCQTNPEKLFEQDVSTTEVQFQPLANFDYCLEEAVKKFQTRHGLVADGVVGGGTQKALNISIESKIETLLLNLDRIKWLPRKMDERYLIANIPEYMIHYIEDGVEKKSLRIIVGDKRHHTPLFAEKISFIVLNPYWKVPEGIVKREIIPSMIKNPNYIRKEGLEIRRTWFERSAWIDPESIYWEEYQYGDIKFPYRIMQPPGPKNALGKIKFKFPNKFDVYLHDTPSRGLFKRTHRAFSHGCVRLSEPHSLLETIASFNENIDLNESDKILKGKRKVQIDIKNKLPIYLVYLTAGFDEKTNELQFRNDIYRYDKMQKRSK